MNRINEFKSMEEDDMDVGLEDAYYVPTTLFVFASVSFPPKTRAKPKSDIFGFISQSSKILLPFRSLWMILNLESW